MWPFSKKKKKTVFSQKMEFEISAEISHRAYNEKESRMIREGCKEGPNMVYYPPDTVFARKHSEVYHVENGCAGVGILYREKDGYILPEAEALRRGLRRCKKCQWKTPQPEPAKRPMKTEIAFIHDTREDY